MKKIQFISCLFLMIFLYSCVKDIDVKLPKVEEKLVINCAISPQDQVIQVDVSLSQPIYYTAPTNDPHVVVTDATVILSSGTDSWTLTYDAFRKKYIMDQTLLKVKAGSTYDLSVSTPAGKFVKASTTVPYQNSTLSAFMTPNSNPNSPNDVTIHASWQDPPNSTDYYEFELENKNSSNYWNYRREILTDEENPGGTLNRNWLFQYASASNDTILAAVHTLSFELYNYYERASKISDSNGPFSEPFPMYTNIDGGFGIFGSFNRYEIKVSP